LQIEGKRVIVTGGSSGMGEAAVRVFVREGAQVASLDVADDLGAGVVAAANEEGPGRAVYHHCDVRSRDDVQAAFERAVGDLGGLDALVHAAGVDRQVPAESMTEEDWDFLVGINLKGTFLANTTAFPYLHDNGGGRIVNFTSAAGQVALPSRSHYAAAKGGVISWSRSIAAEWGRYGINVVTFAPFARTPMIETFREGLGEGRAAFDSAVANTPLGRLGDPETDIAPVLVFLLSDAARYITGQIVAVDGGNVPVR
jgi:NAD(P)-dependent dehydrogenase (short-subunit alcohol dehydrogenase family)